MNDIDRKAQKTSEEMRMFVAAEASHNFRAALAEEQLRCKKYKIAAIVFFVGFAWQFVWNVVKWL